MQCGNVLCRTPSMHASKFIHKTRGACRSTQGLPLSRARQAPRKARELPTLCNHCLPEYDPRLTYRTDREKTPCAWRVFTAKPAICRLSYARATNVPCGAECPLHAPFRALPFRLWGSRSHLQYLNIPPYYASALICLYFQHSTLHGVFHSCTKETARQIRFRML